MVGHVQPVLCIGRRQTRRPLNGTREVPVSGRERRLPHLGEFVHEPWCFGLVGLVVHKNDRPLAGKNHARQGWPVFQGHGNLGRRVDQILQSGALNGLGEVAWCNVVKIADEDADHIVRVCFDPLRNRGQIVLQRTHVEEVAVGVAEINATIDIVGLELH